MPKLWVFSPVDHSSCPDFRPLLSPEELAQDGPCAHSEQAQTFSMGMLALMMLEGTKAGLSF